MDGCRLDGWGLGWVLGWLAGCGVERGVWMDGVWEGSGYILGACLHSLSPAFLRHQVFSKCAAPCWVLETRQGSGPSGVVRVSLQLRVEMSIFGGRERESHNKET